MLPLRLRHWLSVTPLLISFALLTTPAFATTVTLQPNRGPLGTEVTATGTDWPAGGIVYAYFQQQLLTTSPTTIDANGKFTLTLCVPSLPAGTYPTYFTSPSFAGMYSGPIFTITAGNSLSSCQPPTCRPAFFIGVRGSGEPATNNSLGATVGVFYNQFKSVYGETNVNVHGVPYQANLPDFTKIISNPNLNDIYNTMLTFGGSVADGITKLRNVLVAQHAICPHQRFLIVAYSQGAWATGEVLPQLDSTLLAQIVGVVLLGDPKLWWHSPEFAGLATKFDWPEALQKLSGLPGGGVPRKPRYMPDTTEWDKSPTQDLGPFQFRSYCFGHDPFCNATQLDPLQLVSGVSQSQGTMQWRSWLATCLNENSESPVQCEHYMYDKYNNEELPKDTASWFIERLK